ncbi:MAG TPA: ribosome maturation factor RimM [Gemmatimonadaceae bacterium]|nr:ribosome maturation factor RimM [Gemmatimonadaceae bacterium]
MEEHAPALTVVGRVRRPHGIRGEVVMEVLTDEPDAVFASGRRLLVGDDAGDPLPDESPLEVLAGRPFQDAWLVRFARIVDRTDAESWRGRTMLVPTSELTPPDEDEVYLHALVGMRVERVSGEHVGEVSAYFELPHALLLEVRREPAGDTVLVPFQEPIVAAIDGDAGVIRIDPPAGLLE